MIYMIEAFSKKTDFLEYEIEIPNSFEAQISHIMGWTTKQLGFEGYNISPDQLHQLEALIGRKLDDPDVVFQLTCNG